MPGEVYEQVQLEIPHYVGVYVPDGSDCRGNWFHLKAVKETKRKNRRL